MVRKRTSPILRSNNGNGTRPVGRPPVYDPNSHPLRAYKLVSKDNLSQEQLAVAFGVSNGVITQWKDQYPDFLKALKQGWYDWNSGKIVKSLAKRAEGFYVDEEKIFCNSDGDVTRVTTKKYYPPDVAALCMWLTNRMKDEWKHVSRVEHTGADGNPIATKNETLADLLKELLKSKNAVDQPTLTGLRDSIEHLKCANSDPC